MGIRRGSIKRIQHYHHNYCLLCITGCFGCKWYRYKQSREPNKWCDILWFIILVLSLSFIAFFLYFMIIMKNDAQNFNWFIYHQLLYWSNWHHTITGVSVAIFAYCCLIFILALCHAGFGYQIYMHHIHRVLLILFTFVSIGVLAVVSHSASHEWRLQRLALIITGPFIQVGFVIVMTLLTWIIAAKLIVCNNRGLKIFCWILYIAVMFFLYVSPLIKRSPCICPEDELPPKPLLVAHRGGASFAPENTMAAFRHATELGVLAIESDVRVSMDGVLVMMHDNTLHRTTDIRDVFPDDWTAATSSFNSTDLNKLNAGSWFLKNDPFGTTGSLSSAQKSNYAKQKIPTLSQVLDLSKKSNTAVFFDIMPPGDGGHPYHNAMNNLTLETIRKAQLPKDKVWWNVEMESSIMPEGVRIMAKGNLSRAFILKHNISHVNARFDHLSEDDIRFYKQHNISLNMYIVDSEWLYSLYWCMGVTSVTTNWIQTFKELESPTWHLTPSSYLVLWITVDSLSLIIIIVIFLIQVFRNSSKRFSPETMKIQYKKPLNGQMKEKLLYTVESTETLHHADFGVEHRLGVQAIDEEKLSSNDSNSMRTLDVIALTDQQHQNDSTAGSSYEVNVEIN